MLTPSSSMEDLSISADLVPIREAKAAGTSSVTLSGLLPTPLRLHEDLAKGCGGQLWPAGVALAEHLLKYENELLKRSRILELGAGGGLVGLALSHALKIPATVTDQAILLPLMQRNVELNDLSHLTTASVLNWGESIPEEVLKTRPDLILAADCVYFEPAFEPLIKTIDELMAINEGAVVWCCFRRRRRADMRFVKMAEKQFVSEKVKLDEDRERERLFLYKFSKKRKNNT